MAGGAGILRCVEGAARQQEDKNQSKNVTGNNSNSHSCNSKCDEDGNDNDANVKRIGCQSRGP